MCRSASADRARRWPGRFGHFNCDPSRQLARDALAHMADAVPNPAFILLGGDNFGHVPAAREDAAAVEQSHREMFRLLSGAFPRARI